VSEGDILLDVNVPMYAFGQAHSYKESCVWVMNEITEGRLAVAIDTEIIQEVLHRYGALRRLELAVTLAKGLIGLSSRIYPVALADMQLAIDLFQRFANQGKKARDLVHIAVMQNNGIGQIISTDEHFDHIEGVTRLDPRRLFQQAHTQ